MPDHRHDDARPNGDKERVEDVDTFAVANRVRVDQVQALIDRVGNDKEALEEALLIKEAEGEDPSSASE